MIVQKKNIFKNIMESSEGIHLTAYLVNKGSLIDLNFQLRQTIKEAYQYLRPVQTIEQAKKFLEPLDTLLHDSKIFKSMQGNIAIFRTEKDFRVINVPIDVERQCHVANSFHVKPLLRWIQVDHDFLLLGISDESAELYLGNQHSLKKIDSLFFPKITDSSKNNSSSFFSKSPQLRMKQDEISLWLHEWFVKINDRSNLKLFWAGERSFMGRLLKKKMKEQNISIVHIADVFSEENLSHVCMNVRNKLKKENKKTIEKCLVDLQAAEELNFLKENIFQIAKAAVRGKIKKLFVAGNVNIFGKVDKKTGGIALHPCDLNHEDDDILDDLAQTVISSGGEVIVMPKEEIPKRRPILAILK